VKHKRLADIADDEPVTLAEACRLFFGGRLSPSALRTEAAKGNLTIMQIARKDFVTRRAIEEMKEKCRRNANPQDSGSAPKSAPAGRPAPTGSSKTATGMSAQDALRIKLLKRSASSPTTSPKNTRPLAGVGPQKSR
jgi:hypothetical protein